jgi:type III secretion protein L
MGLVVLIERAGWQLCGDSKLLEPDEVCAIHEASQLMHSAETYARRILRSSMKVFDAKASEGFREGERNAVHEIGRRLAELEAARSTLLEALKPALVDLLLDALSRLAHGVERQRLYASALVALEDAWRAARWARLRVHPDDVGEAQAALAELAAGGGPPLHMQVVGDAEVGPRGCRFESDLGNADAGLEVQLAVLREAFDAGLAAWSADETAPADKNAAMASTAQRSAAVLDTQGDTP